MPRHRPCVLLLAMPLLVTALRAQRPPSGGESPAVSPDGKLIAFLSERSGRSELYLIRSDGRDERQLTHGGAGHPFWSPDGRRIRFAGQGPDSGKVFVLPVAGGQPTVAAEVPGRSPVLSPDGKQVLFLQGPWTSTVTAVSAIDGSGLHPIAGGSGRTAWNGVWSPDGKWIAYTYGDSTRTLQVHLVRPDGTDDHAVTHATASDGSAQMPAWSASGSHLAVQVSTRTTGRLWIVDLNAGGVTQLQASGDHRDEVPAWFADGRRVAFQSDRTGRMEIWTMKADGSDQRQVTGTATNQRQ